MWQSSAISSSAYGSTVGPNIVPFGLGALLVLLSLRLFYEVLKTKDQGSKGGKLDYKKFLIIFAAAFLYASSLKRSVILSEPSYSSSSAFRRWREDMAEIDIDLRVVLRRRLRHLCCHSGRLHAGLSVLDIVIIGGT